MHRYSIFLPMLGEGSFGKVFRAKRKGNNEIVALKLIKKHGRTDKELLSLRKECEIQRHFKHPNIIQMLDSFETEGEIVVVTECAYIDLFRILATERFLSESRAGRITSDLVSALYYLHSNRVLHRDLKPQNVLLNENGVVKLCDFGFARNMSLGTHVLTSIKGTPLYMAPELMEENPYDHNADLWYKIQSGLGQRHVRRSKYAVYFYFCELSEPIGTGIWNVINSSAKFKLSNEEFLKRMAFWAVFLVFQVQDTVWPWPASRNEKSLGCIVYEMIVGCPPFKTNNILHLVKLIREEAVRWPDFASPDCLSLLRGLLEKDPARRLSWPRLLDHPFVRGNVLITSDQGVMLPLTAEMTSSQAEAKELQKQDKKAASGLAEAVSEKRRRSSKFMEERGREVAAAAAAAGAAGGTLLLPAEARAVGADFDEEDLLRRLKYMETNDDSHRLGNLDDTDDCDPKEVKELLRLDGGQSSLSPLESEEWLDFLRENISEVMEGDTKSVEDDAFVDMVCRALSSSSSPLVIEYIASLFSIPFALDCLEESCLLRIRRAYAEVKLVPRLMHATQLIVKRANPSSNLNAEELQALEVVLLLVSNLAHTEDIFLEQFCRVSVVLRLASYYAFVVSLRRRKVQIAVNLLPLLSHVVRRMPEYKFISTDFLKAFDNPEVELRALVNSSNERLALRAVVFLREVGLRCKEYLKQVWTDRLQRDLEVLRYSPNQELRSVAENTLLHLLEVGILMENVAIQEVTSAE